MDGADGGVCSLGRKIMPTYEYKCPECNLILNISHTINVEHEQDCLTCLIPMKKGFGGGTGIHFKGSGFYETDYKNK